MVLFVHELFNWDKLLKPLWQFSLFLLFGLWSLLVWSDPKFHFIYRTTMLHEGYLMTTKTVYAITFNIICYMILAACVFFLVQYIRNVRTQNCCLVAVALSLQRFYRYDHASIFHSTMIGTVLLFAEETVIGEQHMLILTFNHPLQGIANADKFTLSTINTTIINSELDSQNSSKVRLTLSGALPATGDVSVIAESQAVLINGAINTTRSEIHVLIVGDILQLRQNLLAAGDDLSDGKIQISNIVKYVNENFSELDKHGITEKAFIQFFLQQIDPLLVPSVVESNQ